MKNGGATGIRTPEGFLDPTRFPAGSLRPLGHRSAHFFPCHGGGTGI